MFDKRAFLLFVFILAISGMAFYFINFALPEIVANPLMGLAIMMGIGVAVYLGMYAVQNMNKAGAVKLTSLMLILVVAAGAFVVVFIANDMYGNPIGNKIDEITGNSPNGVTKLTVYFMDGGKQTLSSDTTQLGKSISLISPKALSIYGGDQNKQIKSIQIEYYVQASWTPATATVGTNYEISGGNLREYIVNKANTAIKIFDSGIVPVTITNKPSLVNGQWAVLSSSTLTASQIEALATSTNKYVDSQYYVLNVDMAAPINLTLHFSDGSTDSGSASICPSVQITFQYKTGSSSTPAAQITGLKASFNGYSEFF